MVGKLLLPDDRGFSLPCPQRRTGNARQFDAQDLTLDAITLQLLDEPGTYEAPDCVVVPWPALYSLLRDDSASLLDALGLKGISDARPVLLSRSGLSDPDFLVAPAGWRLPDSATTRQFRRAGALLNIEGTWALLPQPVWALCQHLDEQNRLRASAERTFDKNRSYFATIRRLACAARAHLSDFLLQTDIVQPQTVSLAFRQAHVGGTRVVEVTPTLEGVPDQWLRAFDNQRGVPERYQFASGTGLVHVEITPEVGSVLREIKQMPGRRVAGQRAEAFIRNPYAVLDPVSSEVLDTEQIESALEQAGLGVSRFWLSPVCHAAHEPALEVTIERIRDGSPETEVLLLKGREQIIEFRVALHTGLNCNAPMICYRGYALDLLSDAPDQLLMLDEALEAIQQSPPAVAEEQDSNQRSAKDGAPLPLQSLEDILDLSKYSERIQEFGVEQRYSSAVFANRDGEKGWFSASALLADQVSGAGTAATEDPSVLEKLRALLQRASEENSTEIEIPGRGRVPVDEIQAQLKRLEHFEAAAEQEGASQEPPQKSDPERRLGLVVKPNIDQLDYQEEQMNPGAPADSLPKMPACLRPAVHLKDHQVSGVGWLQRLFANSPDSCRGGVLADDMGLGKTLQLLTFLARAIEDNDINNGTLIVAPVTLLENWAAEIEKFFEPGVFRVLTLYGETLTRVRINSRDLGSDLRAAGIHHLLQPGWRAGYNVVLTTYETMRQLELSLAAERWDVLICDEAQKIKNPNAMVTRSAKKQNARFRIACTGTPVENSLLDFWCLFDFVQPGLLGSLSSFTRRYRKPIEAETDEQKQRLQELRAIFEPQLLRRTKADVAKDLPAKLHDDGCKQITMSSFQRGLYEKEIETYRNSTDDKSAVEHLGFLLRLKTVCSDPAAIAARTRGSVDIPADSSPKLDWLLRCLERIREAEEKVLVFCELRELQRKLQAAVAVRFGIMPDVVNGETSTDIRDINSRHKRIEAFQAAPGFNIIILSPLATGFGLNIQAANHVIHFTRLWNPAKEDQATDRAYRIGQKKQVTVYCPVVVADDFVTIEQRLDELLEWKRSLSTDMLDGTSEIGVADFLDLEDSRGQRVFHGSRGAGA